MNIKLLHHNNNVVSIIIPKFQPIMTIIFEVIAVLVLPYAFGIFSKKLLSTEGTYSEKLLSTQRVNNGYDSRIETIDMRSRSR